MPRHIKNGNADEEPPPNTLLQGDVAKLGASLVILHSCPAKKRKIRSCNPTSPPSSHPSAIAHPSKPHEQRETGTVTVIFFLVYPCCFLRFSPPSSPIGLHLALTTNRACAIKLTSLRRKRTRRYVSADISSVGIDTERLSARRKV